MIKKLQCTDDNVVITLENGVSISISTLPNRVNLHFDGVEPSLAVSAIHSVPDAPKLQLANYLDIIYTPRNQN